MKRCFVACVVAATLVVAGCGDSDSSGTTATSQPPASSSSTSDPPDTITVQVFFLDENAFNVGRPPFTQAVDRVVSAETPAEGALRALFEGPTEAEASGGLRFVASEATGFADLRIEDGTAHVRLVGGCSSGGSTFTIAEEIANTLRQFEAVDAVKIYDTEGETGSESEPGDSIPSCLEP